MSKEIYRWVICVDIDADNLEQSYRYLYNFMKLVKDSSVSGTEMDWESTDEVYDEKGILVSEEELSNVRMKVLQEKELMND